MGKKASSCEKSLCSFNDICCVDFCCGTVGLPAHEACDWRIWSVDGGIHIGNIQENTSLEIINMLGQVIYRTTLDDAEVFIPIKNGVYIVRVNNSAVKVFVK